MASLPPNKILEPPSVRPFKTQLVPNTLSTDIDFHDLEFLDVEIGCGTGDHPIKRALTNPNRRIIAIEHSRSRYSKFRTKLDGHEEIQNLTPLHTNAVSWITHNLKMNCVDRYDILYPNPYPKQRHLNRRWHAMPFMDKLVNTMKIGSTLQLATNMEFYAEQAQTFLCEHWHLSLDECTMINQNTHPDFEPRTGFELKYLRRGETCYNLIFSKTETCTRA